ncbi:MAG: response regulator [Magnetococcales bacterium]|nr:response regulator [Magnetococcales bacterium]
MFNDLDAALQKELIAVFRIELDEKLLAIADLLLQLEKNLSVPGRNKILEEIFRAAHSIKGASRGVGVTAIADISHRMESLFSVLKKRPDLPMTDAIDAALATLDFMRQAFEQFLAGHEISAQQVETLGNRLITLTDTIQATPIVATAQKTLQEDVAPLVIDEPKPVLRWRPPPIAPVESLPEKEVIHLDADNLERLGALNDEIHITLGEMIDPRQKTHRILEHVEIVTEWMNTQNGIPSRCREAIDEIHAMTTLLRQKLITAGKEMQILTRSMRDEIRQMRMVKATTLTRPLPRLVRDLAQDLGKKATLEIEGDHLIMDRNVLRVLRDPLNHLLRNALDHGIETPALRLAKGKPEAGRISLSFKQTGHRIRIALQEDGGGMDAEEILQTALRKGIIEPQACHNLDREQMLNLIFRPGFTTRDLLTTVSGRGVGLDVVLTNLRTIQGSVQVETAVGYGTTFILDLPLSIATERGLLIQVAEQIMVIPCNNVERIVQLSPTLKIRVENRDAINLDNTIIPLVSLAVILGLQPNPTHVFSKAAPVVVVSNGWHKIAFLVDDALADREMVIKKLPPPLYAAPLIAGGTITGNGRVALVLDPTALVEAAVRHNAQTTFDPLEIDGIKPAVKRILVVDDSITTRTLENNILTNAGYEVQLATNGLEGWEILQKNSCHLVVTDIQMPIMDGFQLTRLIKTSEAHREIPVIMVSSLGSVEDQQQGVAVGADAYIIKGQFETKALLEVVEQLIV